MSDGSARLYTLTGEGMDRIRHSAAFRALSREQAEMAEEMLFTGLGGLNRIPMKIVRARIEALIKEVGPEDTMGLRQVVLGVIEAV